MSQHRSEVGLDVHLRRVEAAVIDMTSGELRRVRLPGETAATVELCASLPGPVRVAYEAGPTGFGLARSLRGAGVACIVAAPGMIPRGARDRIKTDRRDAEKLARLLIAGELRAVHVPSEQVEALRDLVRAREDVRGDLMRARHRAGKLLLRHDVRYPGPGRAWSVRHREWLDRVELACPASRIALADYLGAIDVLLARRAELERQIAALVPGSEWEVPVARLRCLRGVDTLTAVGLCAEVDRFERFPRASALMSYLGLVPSEASSGERRRQGSITKSGSGHARRLLVEAAWHYRHRPHRSKALRSRQEGQPAEAVAVSWAAQQRLHRTWKRLDERRGKRRTVVAVAAARELASFCWAVAKAN